MILQQETVHTETNIAKTKRSSFGIQANGKMFQVLTKNLYPNPVLAALVETSQNAHDAHQRAKKDIPFHVTLPNYLSPNFICRDFGESMSHEFMMGRYCTAFDSTKDDDAGQSGGFGIGKLANLALSSTYNVTCIKDGKRRAYSIFFNSDGIPDIIHTNVKEAVGELDGVEVSVPVQVKDINAFESAARDAFRYYQIKPLIKGVSNFILPEATPSLKGNGWYIDDSINFPVAVSGIYWYKIEPNHIPELTPKQATLLNSGVGLTLLFAPGEVVPQANRHGLYYNDVTCKSVKKRLDEIEAEMGKLVQAEFDKCKNILEAKRLWSYYFSSGEGTKVGQLIGRKSLVWNNISIENDYFRTTVKNPNNQFNHMQIPDTEILHMSLRWSSGDFRVKTNTNGGNWKVDKVNRFFINDLEGGRGCKHRVAYLLRQWARATNQNDAEYFVIQFKTPESRKAFHDLNGTDDSIFESAAAIVVPKEERDSQPGNIKHRVKVFKFNPLSSADKESDYWTPTEIDEDEGGVYIKISRFVPNLLHSSNSIMSNQIQKLIEFGVLKSDVAIYGIKISEDSTKPIPPILDVVSKSPDWIEYSKWFEGKREELVADKTIFQCLLDAKEIGAIVNFKILMQFTFQYKNDDIDAYIKGCQYIQDQESKSRKYKELLSAYHGMGGNVGVTSDVNLKPAYEINKLYSTICKVFPLLNVLASHHNSSSLLSHYFALMSGDVTIPVGKPIMEKI